MRPQTVHVSATPGGWEMEQTGGVFAEQVIRPTGLIDPPVEIRPARSQVDDLLAEVKEVAREGLPHARHHADQAHGRGPHRIPARARRARALHALRHRHAGAHRDHPRPAPRRLRRAGRHQPAARGPRHSRMRARRHPRRRQGRLPALRDLAGPDHRPRRAQRRRPGHPLRRPASPARWSAPWPRPTAAARSRTPTTPSTASRRRASSKNIDDILDSVYERDHVTVDTGLADDGDTRRPQPQGRHRRPRKAHARGRRQPRVRGGRAPARRDQAPAGDRARHRRRPARAPGRRRARGRPLRGRAQVRRAAPTCRRPAAASASPTSTRWAPAPTARCRSPGASARKAARHRASPASARSTGAARGAAEVSRRPAATPQNTSSPTVTALPSTAMLMMRSPFWQAAVGRPGGGWSAGHGRTARPIRAQPARKVDNTVSAEARVR